MIDSPQGEVIFPEVRSQEGSWYLVRATQGLAPVTQSKYCQETPVSCVSDTILCSLLHSLQSEARLLA